MFIKRSVAKSPPLKETVVKTRLTIQMQFLLIYKRLLQSMCVFNSKSEVLEAGALRNKLFGLLRNSAKETKDFSYD